MKKAGTIILFLLLFLNTAGLYLFFSTLIWHEDHLLERRLNSNAVNPDETLLLSFAIKLPYEPDWQNYQRTDGELLYHGQHYNAYEHKIFRDTMYTVYVRDAYKNKLYQKLNNIIALFSNVPSGNNNATDHNINFLKEYLPPASCRTSNNMIFAAIILLPNNKAALPHYFGEVTTPPPEIFS